MTLINSQVLCQLRYRAMMPRNQKPPTLLKAGGLVS